jgi:hypothetical protein
MESYKSRVAILSVRRVGHHGTGEILTGPTQG